MAYKNEAAFSKALCQALRKHNYFVQRIESGTTGKGIPDIYCISNKGKDIWLELKRVHKNCTNNTEIIPWRPGQQAWLNEATRRGVACLTLACFDNCILAIPHAIIYVRNTVDIRLCKRFKNINAIFNS